jgi:branched-chain amino acid transport system substrate-binding protein
VDFHSARRSPLAEKGGFRAVGRSAQRRGLPRVAAGALAALLGAGTAAAAVGAAPTDAGAAAKVGSTVPPSAMSTHVGVTSNSVAVGNITWSAIFGGSKVGAEAYFDYVNSKGGVNGRKIEVTAQDTGYSGTKAASLTEAAIRKDFALVGGFSIVMTAAGQVLARNPGMPVVQPTITPANTKLPNVVSPIPAIGGWQEGSLLYFKSKDPKGITKAAALVAKNPSATDVWKGEKATMEHLGYKIIYETTFPVTATYNDFLSDVVAMKDRGVKMLFIEQNPTMYAAPLIRALNAENFHPMVVLGASTYSDTLIPTSGGAAATTGMYLEQDVVLYLGSDARSVPAVTTFLHWTSAVTSSKRPTLFTLFGWLSAELFTKALEKAGKDPSRGSLLKALGETHTFTGTHIEVPVDPASKTVSNCYLIGRIREGRWVRQTDPPIAGATHGFRCTSKYYLPPTSPYVSQG